MKKLIALLILLFVFLPLSPAQADNAIVRITSTPHQTFTGEFRNDDLAQELTPSGSLGVLVYTPRVNNKTWVIDAALVDEVIAMTGDYTLANDAIPAGQEIATAWLKQLRDITFGQQVVALAYGNPDVSLAKRLAPSELNKYYAFGKSQLEAALGRTVRSEPNGGWSTGKSQLSNTLRKACVNVAVDYQFQRRIKHQCVFTAENHFKHGDVLFVITISNILPVVELIEQLRKFHVHFLVFQL